MSGSKTYDADKTLISELLPNLENHLPQVAAMLIAREASTAEEAYCKITGKDISQLYQAQPAELAAPLEGHVLKSTNSLLFAPSGPTKKKLVNRITSDDQDENISPKYFSISAEQSSDYTVCKRFDFAEAEISSQPPSDTKDEGTIAPLPKFKLLKETTSSNPLGKKRAKTTLTNSVGSEPPVSQLKHS